MLKAVIPFLSTLGLSAPVVVYEMYFTSKDHGFFWHKKALCLSTWARCMYSAVRKFKEYLVFSSSEQFKASLTYEWYLDIDTSFGVAEAWKYRTESKEHECTDRGQK